MEQALVRLFEVVIASDPSWLTLGGMLGFSIFLVIVLLLRGAKKFKLEIEYIARDK